MLTFIAHIGVDNQCYMCKIAGFIAHFLLAEIAGSLREIGPFDKLRMTIYFRYTAARMRENGATCCLPNCSTCSFFCFSILLTFVLIINTNVRKIGKIVAQLLLTYCSFLAHFCAKIAHFLVGSSQFAVDSSLLIPLLVYMTNC